MATEITSDRRSVPKRIIGIFDRLAWLLVALGGACSLLGALGRPGLSRHESVLYWTSTLDGLNNFIPLWATMIALGLAIVLIRRRASRAFLLFGALVLIAALIPIYLELHRAPDPVEPGAAEIFRVLQFNALNSNRDLDAAMALVRETEPDLIMVQEPIQFRTLEPGLRAAYPYRTPCPGQSCDAVIYARNPPVAVEYRTFRGDWYSKGQSPGNGPLAVASMRLLAPDGAPFTAITTHFRWPFPPMPVIHQRDVFLDITADVDRTRAIVTGDFNLTPWTFEMRGFDHDIRPMQRLTRALFSFPTGFADSGVPIPFPVLPIDHVYAGPGWRLVQAKRGPASGSDHYPVIVDLILAPETAQD